MTKIKVTPTTDIGEILRRWQKANRGQKPEAIKVAKWAIANGHYLLSPEAMEEYLIWKLTPRIGAPEQEQAHTGFKMPDPVNEGPAPPSGTNSTSQREAPTASPKRSKPDSTFKECVRYKAPLDPTEMTEPQQMELWEHAGEVTPQRLIQQIQDEITRLKWRHELTIKRVEKANQRLEAAQMQPVFFKCDMDWNLCGRPESAHCQTDGVQP